MAELPVLPLKTDALLADTTHMSAEEFGAYCRILFVMWRQGARLPDDEAELALIAGVTFARWRKIAEKVRRPLTSAGGILSQKRMTGTWLDVQDLRRKRAGAANNRWKGKHANAYANGDAKPMQEAVQTTMQNDANQIPNKNNTSRIESLALGERATALPSGARARHGESLADLYHQHRGGKPQ